MRNHLLRPLHNSTRRNSRRRAPITLKRRQLDRKVSDRRALCRTQNHFEPAAFGCQAIQESVLVSTTYNEQALQLLAGNLPNGNQYLSIPSSQAMEEKVSDRRNAGSVGAQSRLALAFQLCIYLAEDIAGQHQLRVIYINQTRRAWQRFASW